MAFWSAKTAFLNPAHGEVARAFEREYAPCFAPWRVAPTVAPTRRGLFRESGEGAWFELGKVEGMYLEATYVLAERRGEHWVEVTSPSDFARLLREQADYFLTLLEEKTETKR